MKKIKLLLLDFDGVCAPIDIHYRAMCFVFDSCGLQAPSRDEWQELLRPPFAKFYTDRGVKLEDAEVWRRHKSYIMEHSHTVQIFDDVFRILPEIAKSRMVVLVSGGSNGYAQSILGRKGLTDYFKRVVTGAEFKHDVIKEVLTDFGVFPSETMLVGDTAFDMADAVKMEVMPVGSSRGFSTVDSLMKAGARYCVENFHELKVLLDLIEHDHRQTISRQAVTVPSPAMV